MKQFKLRHPKSKYFFKVRIYDSLKKLRKSAESHSKQTGEGGTFDETVGITHTFKMFKIYPDSTEEMTNYIGIIRLVGKHASTQVVAHEIIHAALHQYRLAKDDGVANFGDGCNDQEEEFGHIYDMLFRDMVRKLYKHKIWN